MDACALQIRPQALTELAGGQIDLAVLPVALVQSFVREGKLRGLG